MKGAKKSRGPVLAAGGIVVRDAAEPQFAVVRLRKNKAWVLPKGKLKSGEDALAAAEREVLEETGHDVSVHEFLGTMPTVAGGKPKLVKFWRMHASRAPARKLMRDVKAVRFLPLGHAIETLTHADEREFLAKVGPAALKAAKRAAARKIVRPRKIRKRAKRMTGRIIGTVSAWLRRISHPGARS